MVCPLVTIRVLHQHSRARRNTSGKTPPISPLWSELHVMTVAGDVF